MLNFRLFLFKKPLFSIICYKIKWCNSNFLKIEWCYSTTWTTSNGGTANRSLLCKVRGSTFKLHMIWRLKAPVFCLIRWFPIVLIGPHSIYGVYLPAEYINPEKVSLNLTLNFITSSLHSASISAMGRKLHISGKFFLHKKKMYNCAQGMRSFINDVTPKGEVEW